MQKGKNRACMCVRAQPDHPFPTSFLSFFSPNGLGRLQRSWQGRAGQCGPGRPAHVPLGRLASHPGWRKRGRAREGTHKSGRGGRAGRTKEGFLPAGCSPLRGGSEFAPGGGGCSKDPNSDPFQHAEAAQQSREGAGRARFRLSRLSRSTGRAGDGPRLGAPGSTFFFLWFHACPRCPLFPGPPTTDRCASCLARAPQELDSPPVCPPRGARLCAFTQRLVCAKSPRRATPGTLTAPPGL